MLQNASLKLSACSCSSRDVRQAAYPSFAIATGERSPTVASYHRYNRLTAQSSIKRSLPTVHLGTLGKPTPGFHSPARFRRTQSKFLVKPLSTQHGLAMTILQDDDEAVLTEVVALLPAPGLEDNGQASSHPIFDPTADPTPPVKCSASRGKFNRPRSRRRRPPRKGPRRSASTRRLTPSPRSRMTCRASSRSPAAKLVPRSALLLIKDRPRCDRVIARALDPQQINEDGYVSIPELLEQAQLVDPTRPAHQPLTDKVLARIKLDVCTTPPPVSTWVGNSSRGLWKALFCDVTLLDLQRKIDPELSANNYEVVYNDKKFRPTEQEDDDSDFEEGGEYVALPPTLPVTFPTSIPAEDRSPDDEGEKLPAGSSDEADDGADTVSDKDTPATTKSKATPSITDGTPANSAKTTSRPAQSARPPELLPQDQVMVPLRPAQSRFHDRDEHVLIVHLRVSVGETSTPPQFS
ncbi:unnamed protein product [Phytophthora fragariaefolia]|uniref:Unnamed protein product n=1 Tax=Phytophthora fragariaefolia TaxID=1490495 RepID=A0A9W6WTH0_9STRA|nr:unnamed protein product [Phytophthora fragariaefolia]